MWILFVVLTSMQGPSISTAEFLDEKSCHIAERNMQKFSSVAPVKTMCLKKNTGDQQ